MFLGFIENNKKTGLFKNGYGQPCTILAATISLLIHTFYFCDHQDLVFSLFCSSNSMTRLNFDNQIVSKAFL